MALRPDCSEVLARVAAWRLPAEPTVETARRAQARMHQEFGAPPAPVSSVAQVSIPTDDGPVPASVYTPVGQPEGLLVHIHGGGWMTGSPELSSTYARALASAGGCVVVSVGYRLAPEHPFPAGLRDVHAATCWAAENAQRLGAPAGRTVVSGDSSGGNLAAAVCLMARDLGGPRLAGQLLVCPATARHVETGSRRELAEGYGLTPASLEWYWEHYLPAGQDPSHPYVSPLLTTDLTGLPPAVVVTAEYDILRDEGEAYAQRLREAGVAVIHRRFDGVIHGFLACAGAIRTADSAFDWIGSALRSAVIGVLDRTPAIDHAGH